MNSKDLFLKTLSDYLDLEFSDFDKKRIVGYLDGYVADVVDTKPQVITKVRTVYKYVGEDLKDKIQVDANVVLAKPSEIIDLIVDFTKVSYNQMIGRDRHSKTIVARHTAMYFINKICHLTLSDTGRMFNKDHTSVLNAVKNVRNMIEGGDIRYISLFEFVSGKLPTYEFKKTA
jgi:hypothetical protein